MNVVILNRAGGELSRDGLILAVPAGELYNAEADKKQVMDSTSLRSITADWDEQKQRLGADFPGIYVGIEHHIYDPALSSAALGWAKEWRIDEKGLWIHVEWTDIGEEAIRNKRFKYTSFVVDPKNLEPLGGNRFRVLKVDTVGLTNLPNGKDLLVPITNRAAGPGNEVPLAIQKRAAERIDRLARQDQRASGGSLVGSYLRVMNREKSMTEIANGRPVSAVANAGAREVLEDAASFAGRTILRLAQSRKLPGLSANISYIRNRFPTLSRLENREAGWDVRTELEPQARQAYMDAMQQPRDSMPEPRWVGFFASLDALKVEFQDLGYEGVWQKMKEIYPATFLKFVLSFDDQEGSSDMLPPPPKTEQERYRKKRAIISHAASMEQPRYGRNGPGAEQIARTVVNEALSAL